MWRKKLCLALLLCATLVATVTMPVNIGNDITVVSEATQKKLELKNVKHNKLTIYKGKTTKVNIKNKITGVGKHFNTTAYANNSNVVEVTGSGNKFVKLKGLKVGTTKVTIRHTGFKDCKITVTVKNKPGAYEYEWDVEKELKGTGKKYYGDLEKYPYLTDFNKLNATEKKVMKGEWKALENKHVDLLTKYKVNIIFTRTRTDEIVNNKTGTKQIYVAYGDGGMGSSELMHQSLLMYRDILKLHYGVVVDSTNDYDSDFKNNPDEYGYSRNIGEYWANRMTSEYLCKMKLLSDEDILEYLINTRLDKITTEEVGSEPYLLLYVYWGEFINVKKITMPAVTYVKITYVNGEEDWQFYERVKNIGIAYLKEYYSDFAYDEYFDVKFYEGN